MSGKVSAKASEKANQTASETASGTVGGKRAVSARFGDVPPAVASRPVAAIGAPKRAERAFRTLGIRTIGDLVATPPAALLEIRGFGRRTFDEVVRRVRALSAAEAPPPPRPVREPPLRTLLGKLATALPAAQRRILAALLGDGRAALSPEQIPAELDCHGDDVAATISAARQAVTAGAPEALAVLVADADREIRTCEGVARLDRLAAGSALRLATRVCADPLLPFRLLALCEPRFWLLGPHLCATDRAAVQAALQRLRRATGGDRLPARVDALATKVAPQLGDHARGLVEHLLTGELRLSVVFHPVHGEIVRRRRPCLADRIEAILEDLGQPVHLDDLLFHYRDRHATGRRDRLLDHLRADSRFLEVERERWSLRAFHLDEIELVRPLADSVRAEIRAAGERRNVHRIAGEPPPSERTRYLLIDGLRRAPDLRDLGRGDFCRRHVDGSPLVRSLVAELRRAMGEVPFSRFLQNQPPARRRLVARLLRENRLFVQPDRDRVDLLENYPFNPERMRMLLHEVAGVLDAHSGYAPLERIRRAVEASGLGGSFLGDALLLDLLRRHGRFEILPGPILAEPHLRLGPRIQRTARDVLRAADEPLSADQLVAARPELAEFHLCLRDLLELDPLVHSSDGLHYELL